MNNLNILVIDDEAVVRDLATRVLSSEGYSVDTAENGDIAREKLRQKTYALCLIDLKMPGIGGKEMFTYIKEKYPELAQRVIFVTGNRHSQSTQDFLTAAGRPRLSKPFSLTELRKVVAEELPLPNELN